MSFDNWLTTEPVEVCYHEPCPHNHCEICEGKECCEECEIEAENERLADVGREYADLVHENDVEWEPEEAA